MSNEASKNWMIYGAYGYTGELVVQEAIAQQRQTVLAGRNDSKTKAVAEKYNLSYKAFGVDDAGDFLQDIDIMINCAGPFDQTAEPLMDACIKHSVHYFDISGEIPIYEAAHDRHDRVLRDLRVALAEAGQAIEARLDLEHRPQRAGRQLAQVRGEDLTPDLGRQLQREARERLA